MPLPEPLFRIRYDWDTGTWAVVVGSSGQVMAIRRGFDLEIDAEQSLAELRHMLVTVPDGNVERVLREWERDGFDFSREGPQTDQ